MLPQIVGLWLVGAVQGGGSREPGALRWSAPPECPDLAGLTARIERRLGRPLAPGEAQLEGRVVRERAGYALRMRLSTGARDETRELRDAACDALADAAALLVAAALEPASLLAPAPPSPTREVPVPEVPAREVPVPEVPAREVPAREGRTVPVPELPPQPVPVTDPPLPDGPAEPQAPASRAGGLVRLHGGGELGAVPRATGALGLAGGVLWARWRLELGGLFVAPQTEARARGEARVGLLAATLQGCRRAGRGAVEVPLCLGIEAGGMRGEGRRVAGERSAVAGWLAILLGPGLAWHASRRWSVFAGLQLVIAPVRPRFELGDPDRSELLFRPSLVSGRLFVGVELRLADPW